MMDWVANKPNARYWVLKLIKDNFHAGDKLVETSMGSHDLSAQAFITPSAHKLLLVNKRNKEVEIGLGAAGNATAQVVDVQSGEGPARTVSVESGKIALEPFAVAVVSW
jgi:hypothetical protein